MREVVQHIAMPGGDLGGSRNIAADIRAPWLLMQGLRNPIGTSATQHMTTTLFHNYI